MRILSLVHGPLVRPELFGDVALADGHELEEWSVVDAPDPPRPIDDYDAVFVFGGHMNVDQEDEYPWLTRETELVRELVEREMPVFGVCLGGQLLAKAAGAHVGPSPEPEYGFVGVTATEAAADDPVFGALPARYEVFSAHDYAFHAPEGGVELAVSPVCSQAFRLGPRAWGIQFHPEVRVAQVAEWFASEPAPANAAELLAELRARYDEWREFGVDLCRRFLVEASRAGSRTDDLGAIRSR